MTAAVRTGNCTTGRRRVARKDRFCGRLTDWCLPIRRGDVYLESTEFPGGDSGYADTAGRPVRMAVCAPCVCARHDGHLLDPIPYEQCARQGLL